MNSRRSLQIAVAIAGLVPVSAGALGALRPELLSLSGPPHAFTHAAYLSGLLLGIGIGFWSAIPGIETHRGRVTLLTAIVVLGGLARLLAAARMGVWTPSVTLPLVMELGVTPAMWLWQGRISRCRSL